MLDRIIFNAGAAFALFIVSAAGCRNGILGHRQRNDTFIQVAGTLFLRRNISALDVLTSTFDQLTAAAMSLDAAQVIFEQAVWTSFAQQATPRIYSLELIGSASTQATSVASVREVTTGSGTAVSLTSAVLCFDHRLELLFTYELAAELGGLGQGQTGSVDGAAVKVSLINYLGRFTTAASPHPDLAAALGAFSIQWDGAEGEFSSEVQLVGAQDATGGTSASSFFPTNDSLAVVSRRHSAQEDLCFALLGDWGKGGLSGDLTNMSSTAEDEQGGQKNGNRNKNKDKNKNTYTYQNAVGKVVYAVANAYYGRFEQYTGAAEAASGSTEAPLKPSFVAALGDNFYAYGVASVDDSQWESSWQAVYITNPAFPPTSAAPNAMLNISWYAIFGNHDYGYGSAGTEAQIRRTNSSYNFRGLWNFPAQFYTRSYSLPPQRPLPHPHASQQQRLRLLSGETDDDSSHSSNSSNSMAAPSVKIIYLDTTTLSPSMNKCCNANGGVSEELQLQRVATQLAFIESELQAVAGRYTWLVVAGHYPMYSTGGHGDGSELQGYLLPLLLKYGVHAYVCGHDHISEHLSSAGVHYFITGAGAMTDKVGATTSAAQVHWSGGGFSAFSTVSASSSELCVTYFNITGHVVYNYTMQHPGLPGREFVTEYANVSGGTPWQGQGESDDYYATLGDSGGDSGARAAEERHIMIECALVAVVCCLALATLSLMCFVAFREGDAGHRHSLLDKDDSDAISDATTTSASVGKQVGRFCDAANREARRLLGAPMPPRVEACTCNVLPPMQEPLNAVSVAKDADV